MELKHVKIFVLAAELLNFTKAAELSFLSQSSVTKYIQCLEDELGGKLFVRDGRKTALTELGKLFLPYAVSLMDTEQESMEVLRSFQAGFRHRVFRIGLEDALFVAPPELFFCTLVGTLKHLHTREPGVIFDVKYDGNDTLQSLLENDQIDMVVRLVSDYREETLRAPEYCCETLDSNGFILVVSENVDTTGGYREILERVENILYDVYALPQNIPYAMSKQFGVNRASKTYPHWMDLYMDISLNQTPMAALVAANMKEIAERCGLKTVPMDDFGAQNSIRAYWKQSRQDDIIMSFVEEFKTRSQLEKRGR